MMLSIQSIRLLLIFVILLISSHSYAQQAWTIYNAVNSPLPENSVRCITIAPDGKKWIGTDYGLASFDDVNWTVYYTNNSGLPDNSIRSIAVDSNGVVWVGTFSSGLVKFDGTTWTNYNTFNSDIPDDFVRSLAIDTLGNKWVGTIGGLAYFNDVSWEVYDMSNTGMLSNNISSLNVDVTDNSVAIGTINGGLALFDGTTWTFLNIWNTNLPDNTILGITKDTSGTIWIATPASGLSAFIGGFAFLTLNTISSAIQSNSLTGIGINRSNDNIWIASNDEGVIRKSELNFVSFNTANSPLPDNFIQAIMVASDGIIWIGTQTGGLVRLDESLLSSVEGPEFLETLNVFPVPAKCNLTVRLSEKTPLHINIYSLTGQKISETNFSESGNEIELNVSHLPAGNYFLKIQFTDGSYAGRKIMVTK